MTKLIEDLTAYEQQRLAKITESLPLDSVQRKNLVEGIQNLKAEEAKAIADELTDALAKLTPAVTRLESLLNDRAALVADLSKIQKRK